MSIATDNEIQVLVEKMQAITLKEMDHVKLMHRTDTKYVFPAVKLSSLLAQMREKYFVLSISNSRIHRYDTLYYDTPSFDMYHNHHNKRVNRYKVRVRTYKTSDDNFLEVKFKNNKKVTTKTRTNSEFADDIYSDKCLSFLKANSPFSMDDLVPSLYNSFDRITLVHKFLPERITIDRNISFTNASRTITKDAHQVCIIEVKRDLNANYSEMVQILRNNRIKPLGFSKYCMGTAMVQNNIRKNRFKEKIRLLDKYKLTTH